MVRFSFQFNLIFSYVHVKGQYYSSRVVWVTGRQMRLRSIWGRMQPLLRLHSEMTVVQIPSRVPFKHHMLCRVTHTGKEISVVSNICLVPISLITTCYFWFLDNNFELILPFLSNRPFWVSWKDGFVALGLGADAYVNPMLNQSDPYGVRDFISIHLANWNSAFPVEWQISKSSGTKKTSKKSTNVYFISLFLYFLLCF